MSLEWIEGVPTDWKISESQFVLDYQSRDVQEDDEIVTAFRDGQVTLRSNRRTDGFTMADKEIGYQHICEGDLVVHSMDGGFGAIGVSDSCGKASPVVHAYTSTSCDLRFVSYQLRAAVDAGWIAALAKGIRVRSTQFDRPALANLKIAYPSIETQQRIADYLDRETAEIDAAVADLDRYVDLLEKRRREVIYETLKFRKGPGSGMTISDSQRSRVGFVTRLLRRGISPRYVDEGVPVVNQKCVRPGGLFDINNCRYHDPEARSVDLDLTIQHGDILINSTGTGTLGRSCMVREVSTPITWDSHVTLVRPNPEVAYPGYLSWMILSQESKLIEFSTGSTNQIELSRDTVFNLDFINVPLDLQKKIAFYLDRETVEIDALIADSTKLRELLLKRRSVLITDVVTGRKQV
ncbi:hypothetical protein [Corynebacterium humireducens]|uniref:hypothetical protein n=1 Tax=Corynebacterium humireducens TaxID=1223514 RepID=UPI000AA914DA|nr:hypothetical protein [Corynebacterium humireducens]